MTSLDSLRTMTCRGAQLAMTCGESLASPVTSRRRRAKALLGESKRLSGTTKASCHKGECYGAGPSVRFGGDSQAIDLLAYERASSSVVKSSSASTKWAAGHSLDLSPWARSC